MRAVIIGAGIGGLAAAVALRRVGIEALVLERASEISEVGAGLSLWSNAVTVLRELGLEAPVLAAASVVERNVTRWPDGRPIAENDLATLSREAGAPCICIHRAALQKILLDALPPTAVGTNACCRGFEGSNAVLESGERITADILVGADGISSVIRAALHGVEEPRYAAYTCWRGICAGEGVLPERSALLVIGRGSQFGVWPCGNGQLYWFLTRNAPAGTMQTKADVMALCQDWAAPVPQVVKSTPEDAILPNDIVDRPPLTWWGRGKVTLLGDAAHAATPNLGQGACQALEDAVVLAHCLSKIRPPEAALREYERLRIPRTSAVVRDSWRMGKVLQLDSPALEWLRNSLMGSWLGQRAARRTFRSLLTYQLPRLRPPSG